MGALACAFSWDTLPSTVLAATGTRAIERDMMRVVVGGGVEVEEFGGMISELARKSLSTRLQMEYCLLNSRRFVCYMVCLCVVRCHHGLAHGLWTRIATIEHHSPASSTPSLRPLPVSSLSQCPSAFRHVHLNQSPTPPHDSGQHVLTSVTVCTTLFTAPSRTCALLYPSIQSEQYTQYRGSCRYAWIMVRVFSQFLSPGARCPGEAALGITCRTQELLQARCTMLSVPSPVHTRLCGPGTRPRDPPHPLRALERWIECPLIAHRATLRTGLTQLLGACRHCTWEPHIGHRRADALAAHTQRSPVLPQLTCARSVRLQPGFSSRRGAYVFDGAGRVVWATALALWRCPARCHGGRQLGTQFGYAAGRSYATARHGGRLRPVCVYIRSCALALQAPCVLRCAGRKAESQEPLTRPPADRVGSERLEVGGRNSTCSQWCER
jgi:hypothetical protein